MAYKIVFIGGGSVLWTPRLCTDMFLEEKLKGSELHLVDIDSERLKLTLPYLQRCDQHIGSGWKILISTEDEALKDADVVIVSISTGGLEAMQKDYEIPERYGVYHTVGDTVGPAGISRTLRNIPVFINIAKKMEKLCPGTVMLHVTNPLTQITRAVNKATSVQCVGMCHEYINLIKMLQDFFNLESRNDIDSLCMGVNHFIFMTDLKIRGINDPYAKLTIDEYMKYEHSRDPEFKAGTTDDEIKKIMQVEGPRYPHEFNFYIYEQLGYFPLEGSTHLSENLPYFCNTPEIMKKFHINRKGVLPNRAKTRRVWTDKFKKTLDDGSEPPEVESRSNEMLCDAVVGLCTGEARRIIAALPNQGQIDNLERDIAVETWAMTSLSGVHPVVSGKMPAQIKGFMEQIIAEQELTVKAALEGDKKAFVQALFNSPQLHEKNRAQELAEELLEAHKAYLPQFFK